MPQERLQKILARWGVASRRKAEELILAGRVSVNGKTIIELGAKADAETDDIRVAGKAIHKPRALVYLALNKPKGCVTTMHDPEGRETVMKFVRRAPERVYPVGRLDYNSEGLLLFTNDGGFANAITSARTRVPKVYHIKSNGPLTAEQEQQFREGVPLHGRRTARARINLIRRGENPWYEVEIVEGRQNQIRLMFQHFGRMVEKLKRVRIGFLELGDLPHGEWRLLSPKEVHRFRALLELGQPPSANAGRKAAVSAGRSSRR
jgi:23S rRNA pseudouridine2605 synthase